MKKLAGLGQFEVTSGKVVISDPCYPLGALCQYVLENVKNGKWNASVEESDEDGCGTHFAALYAIHEGYALTDSATWVEQNFDVCVDSGQVGIFDFSTYRNDEVASKAGLSRSKLIQEDEPGDQWYNLCCDRTLDEFGAGIIPGGAVSSSGCSDGGCTIYTIKDSNGSIVAIQIIFIEDSDD